MPTATKSACPETVLQLLDLQNFFLTLERPRKNSGAHAEAIKKVREFGRVIKDVEKSSIYRSYIPGPEILDFCKKLHADAEKLLK